MAADWSSWLSRWNDAGLIDSATAERIRAFEHAQAGQTRLRWPIVVALAFGAVMLAGGVLLFVAAHWDTLSPAARFSLVLLMVGAFHAGGTVAGDRFPAMSEALHAVGTVALGAGIALSGQIFHLDEHWPGGVMLWALGAGLAWWLLRDTAQMVLFAMLGPAWLMSEWVEALHDVPEAAGAHVLAMFALLLATSYFTAPHGARSTRARHALLWLGGLTFPLAAAFAAESSRASSSYGTPVSLRLLIAGMVVAIAIPLVLSYVLRGREAWTNALAAVWIVILFALADRSSNLPLYGWWAVAGIALVGWGVRDGRAERINMGAALFAATVLFFYFSQVMDKLGRSASLIGLGLLFLAGGWALERMRRRLVTQARGDAA